MPSPESQAVSSIAPAITVIMPVHNGAAYLRSSLEALAASTVPYECIVIDDGSTDDSREVALAAGVRLIEISHQGPAVARNMGAAVASAGILLFIDADVSVYPESLQRVLQRFEDSPELDGVIGSYDDSPESADFVSQYRNLMHHFVHQTAKQNACTFWSGFGAIRKDVFEKHGGFSSAFSRPAIEDIELGYRLRSSGCRIELNPSIQVKHLKKWTFLGLIRTDVLDRGVPWTELILRDAVFPNDLNLCVSQRISVALAFLFVGISLVASFYNAILFVPPLIALLFLMLSHYEIEVGPRKSPRGLAGTVLLVIALAAASLWAHRPIIFVASMLAFLQLLWLKHYYSPHLHHRPLISALSVLYLVGTAVFVAYQLPGQLLSLALFLVFATLISLNARFYTLLAAKRGPVFAIGAMPFHMLFFLYSGIAFGIGLFRHQFRKRTPVSAGRAEPAPHETPGLL